MYLYEVFKFSEFFRGKFYQEGKSYAIQEIFNKAPADGNIYWDTEENYGE